MNRKKIFKIAAIVGFAGLLIGGGIGGYMFFMPHRNVQAASTDYKMTSSEIVKEYLDNKEAANNKYLSDDGDSKILEISGPVKSISENFEGNKVVLLQGEDDKAGVSATFSKETNNSLAGIEPGQTLTVKGVIRSGASYDEDLELYIHVILEKSDIVSN
jgi:hypothetical protein